ncbi:1-propanol dehydrogenase PduQ [Neobacillus sp. OS1-33]|uniref:1-propanol dehydrogenase PduQ n=1 Tax=Neobacillus sp. OS1-33 TaxID=3070683 RepID=UPI0027DFB023|nr:1-propanol dehydrogenase PduQ [Neobacillus sp. OS1-33]WML24653.1 1-propanol dehydrogenase PduQ [Neobacillus sp. OS1-33]
MIIEDQFILKTKVYLNRQSLQYLKQIKGSRAFIVSDSIMESLGYLQQVVDYLNEAEISSTIYTGVRPDPDVALITEGLKLFRESGADVLIAIGGGSAIDSAKGILYFAWKLGSTSGEEIQKPLFIAIPSTSGTGSEVTDFSVITSEGEKVVIIDEFIAPDIAILDSTCIQHVPPRVIADTGIDVLVHAIEAYVSTKANDFSDALAEKAIKLIFENLENLFKDPKNDEARDRVLNASCLAGMAFSNTGLGINHSLAHAFGATFHISHGRSNALLLNAVMEYNADLSGSAANSAADRYSKLAGILQKPARTKREGAVHFMLAVKQLKKALGVENQIRALGIDQAEFANVLEHMAETAMLDRCTPSNPRQPSKDDLVQILKKCY